MDLLPSILGLVHLRSGSIGHGPLGPDAGCSGAHGVVGDHGAFCKCCKALQRRARPDRPPRDRTTETLRQVGADQGCYTNF